MNDWFFFLSRDIGILYFLIENWRKPVLVRYNNFVRVSYIDEKFNLIFQQKVFVYAITFLLSESKKFCTFHLPFFPESFLLAGFPNKNRLIAVISSHKLFLDMNFLIQKNVDFFICLQVMRGRRGEDMNLNFQLSWSTIIGKRLNH